jgi:hypothetical protein
MDTISFSTVKIYLDAIAAQAANDISNSPHLDFWNVDYTTFKNSSIPNVRCSGQPIPFINHAAPEKSAFFLIMKDPAGFCGKRQMPGGGPFITDPGYQITLADGTAITGQQIQNDISFWLLNGFPEQAISI